MPLPFAPPRPTAVTPPPAAVSPSPGYAPAAEPFDLPLERPAAGPVTDWPSAPTAAPTPSVFGGQPTATGQPPLSAAMQQAAALLLATIEDDESSEVIINGPGEVLEKVKGRRYHVQDLAFDDADTLHRVLNDYVLTHCDTADRIDGVNPLVEGQMELASSDPDRPPMLARVHILCPPLVPVAKVTIAKKARYEFDLDGIAAGGALSPQMAEFLKAVAIGRLTHVISGPTGSGKTTLLQAISRHFDPNDRVVVIEDTPELRLPLADVVYLTAGQAKPGVRPEDIITTEWLVKATQRMRMNRVIVGECRGAEIAEWLIAANSGADGSATTVHADNPRRALDKIISLATKSPTAASEPTLRREVAATVDVVIQAGLIDDQYVVTGIEEVSTTVRQDNGIIATQPIFEYNRATGRHEVRNRPSDDLLNTLRLRGVEVSPTWFR